ncbi:hypothetical protein OC845_001935 [Tilletia horrida]|nr:hypothetical protein OC845_001935 [Tilletia horrida]
MSGTEEKAGQLDLSALESHSGAWSADLRWCVCIAVSYAAQRCQSRVQALYAQSAVSHRLQEDWQSYLDGFLQATCQHLGIQQAALPPGPLTVEDVLAASYGRITDDETHKQFQKDIVMPHEATLERGISLERELAARLSTQDKIRKQEEEQRGELAHDADEDAVELSWDHVSSATEQHQRTLRKLHAIIHPQRKGGPLSNQNCANQIPHELLLIALGLGRFRDEHTTGSEPLFEGEAAFGGTELDNVAAEKAKVEQEKATVQKELKELQLDQGPATPTLAYQVRRPSAIQSGTARGNSVLPPKPQSQRPADTATQQNDPFAQAGAAFGKAWTSFAKGATTFASNTAEVAKNATQSLSGQPNATAQDQSEKSSDQEAPKTKQPVKPNEPFHFDARARAIIFVAFLAMGGEPIDIWRAEKVLAQTIYFILSSARHSQEQQGKADPLTAGSGNDRTESMNTASASSIAREKLRSSTWAKRAAIGAGFAVGGVVVGLTGGLAAPLIAPALAGLTGVAFLGSAGGVLALGTLLGLGGGGLAGYRVRRRLQGIDSFTFIEVGESANIKKELEEGGTSSNGAGPASLQATITVPGLVLKEGSGVKMWDRVFSDPVRLVGAQGGSPMAKPDGRDVFACAFEQKLMAEAGEALYSFVRTTAIKQVGTKAATEILKTTAMAGLTAITLPMTVVSATGMALDGLFARAKTKSARAGLVLAETLIEEVQGHRPTVLIAHSLGCVTVMEALLELSRRAEGQTCASDNGTPAKDGAALPAATSTGKMPAHLSHIVDSVYLISAPCRYSAQDWTRARRVVSRRFVNAYSSKDLVSSIATILGDGVTLRGIAQGSLSKDVGVQAAGSVGVGPEISERDGIEDVDVSDIIVGHFDGVVELPDRSAIESTDRLNEVLKRLGVHDS